MIETHGFISANIPGIRPVLLQKKQVDQGWREQRQVVAGRPVAGTLTASAGLSYQRGFTSASVSYSRGANGGSGVLPGAVSDSISGSLGRTFGHNWVGSLNAAYTRSAGLTQVFTGNSVVPVNEVFDSVYGGAQVTRRISLHFSGYATYVAQNQSQNNNLAVPNALNGTSQTFGVGITFTPRSTRLGQF